MDIDLLGRNLPSDEARLSEVFREIASIQVEEDGVTLSPDSVRVAAITAQTEYGGLRVELEGSLEQVRKTLQVDIGFGDVIVPHATEMEFPSLLDISAPTLAVYSLESAIAGKFEAMIRFSYANSRMKDFYDIYVLSTQREFDGRTLQEAIYETFSHRGTPIDRNAVVLDVEFGQDPRMRQQWTAFQKRLREEGNSTCEFSEALARIRGFLTPIYVAICTEHEFFAAWDCSAGLWSIGHPDKTP